MFYVKNISRENDMGLPIFRNGKDGVNGSSPLVGSRNSKGLGESPKPFFISVTQQLLSETCG